MSQTRTLTTDVNGLVETFRSSLQACEQQRDSVHDKQLAAYWQGRIDSMRSAVTLLESISRKTVVHLGEHVHTQACYSDFGVLACEEAPALTLVWPSHASSERFSNRRKE